MAEINVIDKNGLRGLVIEEVELPPNSDSWMLIRFDNGQLVLAPSSLLNAHDKGGYYLAASAEELLAKRNVSGYQDLGGITPVDTRRMDAGQGVLTDAIDKPTDMPGSIPVVEEKLKIERRNVELATVKVHKRVEEHTEVVDLPLQSQEVEIERVAVNQIVEKAIPVRVEGDTTIIPLLEEVLVVEKRLLLREEVHIRKVHKEVHAPQEVLLRKEIVDVERVPAPGIPDKGTQQLSSTQ